MTETDPYAAPYVVGVMSGMLREWSKGKQHALLLQNPPETRILPYNTAASSVSAENKKADAKCLQLSKTVEGPRLPSRAHQVISIYSVLGIRREPLKRRRYWFTLSLLTAVKHIHDTGFYQWTSYRPPISTTRPMAAANSCHFPR